MAIQRTEHGGGAVATTITAGISSSDLTIPIAASTGWPTGSVGPFYVIIDPGIASEEKILVLSRSGTTLTVSATGNRGKDGTSAQSHSSGAAIKHIFTAAEADDANDHIYTTSRDDHTQYLNTTRHDVTTRHQFGAALGTPGTPSDIATAGAAGAGTVPARSDHTHKVGTGAINSSAMFAAGAVDTAALAAASVTLAKMANLAANSILGNNTGSGATPIALTTTQVKALLAIANTDVSGLGTLATLSTVGTAQVTDGSLLAGDMASGAFATGAANDSLFASASAAASGSTTVTAVGNPATTPQAITGTKHTLTPSRVGQLYMFIGTVDVNYTGASSGGLQEAVTAMSIDGSTTLTNPQIIGKSQVAGVLIRATLAQCWFYTSVDTSSHTFELKTYKLNASDTVVINPGHTHLDYVRFG